MGAGETFRPLSQTLSTPAECDAQLFSIDSTIRIATPVVRVDRSSWGGSLVRSSICRWKRWGLP